MTHVIDLKTENACFSREKGSRSTDDRMKGLSMKFLLEDLLEYFVRLGRLGLVRFTDLTLRHQAIAKYIWEGLTFLFCC